MKLLDVGGGPGGSKLPDAFAGYEHFVLDLVPSSLPHYILDARKLVYTPNLHGKFDAVYCSHTLEHFDPQDIPAVVAGIRAVLTPHGNAFIRVPDMEQVFKRVELSGGNLDYPIYAVADGTQISYRDLIWGHPRDINAHGDPMRHRHGFTPRSLWNILSVFFDQVGVAQNTEVCELQAVARCDKNAPLPGQWTVTRA